MDAIGLLWGKLFIGLHFITGVTFGIEVGHDDDPDYVLQGHYVDVHIGIISVRIAWGNHNVKV